MRDSGSYMLSFTPGQIAECNDLRKCRTPFEIISSSVAMIFGCTWVAIHPNVPHPGDTTISRFLKRTRLVLFTLIAPEMTVMWAMRQFWASYKFKQKHNENGAFL